MWFDVRKLSIIVQSCASSCTSCMHTDTHTRVPHEKWRRYTKCFELLCNNDASSAWVCIFFLAGLSFQHQLALRITATVCLLTMQIFFCDPITYFVHLLSPHLTSREGVCTQTITLSTPIHTLAIHYILLCSTTNLFWELAFCTIIITWLITLMCLSLVAIHFSGPIVWHNAPALSLEAREGGREKGGEV